MRMIHKVVLGGAAITQLALLYLTYRTGCQQGVDVTKKVVHKYAPEVHDVISEIMNSDRK